MFEAQKVTTLFCSHKCNSANYKLRKKLEKISEVGKEITQPQPFKPKVSALSRAMLQDKDFLSVKEISVLLGCSRQTVYTLINTGKIQATNLNKKKTLIKRSNIDKLFN